MPEWLIDRGIGETRAALVDGGNIIEARVELEGTITAGTVLDAKVTKAVASNRNVIAVSEDGTQYLLPRGAPGIAEGATLSIEVTRSAIPGTEPWKLPLARATDRQSARVESLAALDGRSVVTPPVRDELADAGWEDLLEEARSGVVRFQGGELRLALTPAMTLIDVDGYLPPDQLARAGASEAARAIQRLDIGGSIGIDLPSVSGKDARMVAAEAIDDALPKPFERTAVNGFGFVQIVRPRLRASLLELASDRVLFEARALLRRAGFEQPGRRTLVANPAVVRALQQQQGWLDRLGEQLGGIVDLRAAPELPISGGYAEAS